MTRSLLILSLLIPFVPEAFAKEFENASLCRMGDLLMDEEECQEISSEIQQLLPPSNLTNSDEESAVDCFASRVAKTCAVGVIIDVGTIKLTEAFRLYKLVERKKLTAWLGWVDKVKVLGMARQTNMLAKHLGAPALLVSIFVAPVSEEFLYRYLLQTVTLRQLPQYVLEKMGLSDHAESLDTVPFVIARIFTSSLIFAYGHRSYSYVTYPMIGGLVFGTLYEIMQYPFASIVMTHGIGNFLIISKLI